MDARTKFVMISWNLMVVTFFAFVTALKDWSLMWWFVAFSLLLLPKDDDQKSS